MLKLQLQQNHIYFPKRILLWPVGDRFFSNIEKVLLLTNTIKGNQILLNYFLNYDHLNNLHLNLNLSN